MSFSNSLRVIALASAAVVLPAQESTRIAGPTSGLVYDAPSRSLRVVMGVPGAAYLGGALASDLDGGSVSPNGRFALTVADGALNLVSLADQAVSSLGSSAGCASGAAAMAWSADSGAVAVGCAGGVGLFRVAGGGVAERLSLAALDGVTSLAVDNAGAAVFATRADGIYRVDSSDARMIAAVENASGLVLAGADTLYAVDRAGKRVMAVDHLATSAALRQVAGEAQGLADPVAVGVSPDGQQLFVAEAGEGRAVRVFNAATLEMRARLELDFDPARVDALGNGLYLLNARKEAGDTMHVLDARQLAVYFVPAQDLGSVTNLED